MRGAHESLSETIAIQASILDACSSRFAFFRVCLSPPSTLENTQFATISTEEDAVAFVNITNTTKVGLGAWFIVISIILRPRPFLNRCYVQEYHHMIRNRPGVLGCDL